MPYVYLIQPAELVGTNRYKIGMSRIDDLSRVRSYKKGTRYIMICECIDALDVEQKLIREFNKCYNRIAGNEYFESNDELEMINCFSKITTTCRNETHHELNAKSDWMNKFGYK